MSFPLCAACSLYPGQALSYASCFTLHVLQPSPYIQPTDRVKAVRSQPQILCYCIIKQENEMKLRLERTKCIQ